MIGGVNFVTFGVVHTKRIAVTKADDTAPRHRSAEGDGSPMASIPAGNEGVSR